MGQFSSNAKKAWGYRWLFRSLFKTIYFNFHFLPFKQAVLLPIWLYKPRFGQLTGKIHINNDHPRTGMIKLGNFDVGLYPNNGIYLSIEGVITFHGTSLIGNDSYVCIGPSAFIEFGNNFRATASFKLSCFFRIIFSDNVRFGWDCLISDSDFHKMRLVDGGYSKGYGDIHIGESNWIANGCKILKGTNTPDFCTISSGTTTKGVIDVPQYSVIGQNPEIIVISKGRWLDPENNSIIEYL